MTTLNGNVFIGLYDYRLLALSIMIVLAFAAFATLHLRRKKANLSSQTQDTEERYSTTLAQNAKRVALIRHQTLNNEIKERKDAQARLNYLMFHDTHTGLWNREYLFEQMRAAQQFVSTLKNFQCTLIYLDLDKFKQINDVFGHRLGDLILTEISKRLTACAGPEDILARMGGDKFALLFHP